MMVSFKISSRDAELISDIVDRAAELVASWSNPEPLDTLAIEMDITACLANDCPLNLKTLIEFDDGDFAHDVFGISQHIDRETGQLQHHFWPRCARPE